MNTVACPSESSNEQSATRTSTNVVVDVAQLTAWADDFVREWQPWQGPFFLAQRLQGIPGALEAGPGLFQPAVRRFYDDVGSDALDGRSFEDFYFEFQEVWDTVRVPGAGGAVAAAVLQAQAEPITLLGALSGYPHPVLPLLASVAFYLARLFPDGIVLPQTQLGELLHVGQATVSRMIRMLRRHELLTIVDDSWIWDPTKGKKCRGKLYAFNHACPAWQCVPAAVRLRVVQGGRA